MTSPEIIVQVKAKNDSEPLDVKLKPEFVDAMWKLLVRYKGERRAVLEFLRVMSPEVISQKFSKAKSASEPFDVKLRPSQFAVAFWEKLVNAVGERRAKHIMHAVMDYKKTGRHGEFPMIILI